MTEKTVYECDICGDTIEYEPEYVVVSIRREKKKWRVTKYDYHLCIDCRIPDIRDVESTIESFCVTEDGEVEGVIFEGSYKDFVKKSDIDNVYIEKSIEFIEENIFDIV